MSDVPLGRNGLPQVFMDHFQRPRNTGVLEGDDVIRVDVENPVCGDLLRLHARISAAGEVEGLRFQVYGCPAAIAAGSILTEMLLGKKLADLPHLGADEIAAALGGLGSERFHGAVLAADGLKSLRKKSISGC